MENRAPRTLKESDFLLGVHDLHRPGALRFRLGKTGPFLDDSQEFASPPFASLRELEYASGQLDAENTIEQNDYDRWLRMLIAPGGSLGGARPKASVTDQQGHLWIAKFPSQRDDLDVGAWEMVLHRLAARVNINVAQAELRRFNSAHRCFLVKRFDRTTSGHRLHFASAMTLLGRTDGDDASTGTSYLELAEFIARSGANTDADLEELWRRIVFFMLVSNTDDHLRNHGFLLEPGRGWRLAPAYDMNPNPLGECLKLNVTEADNSQNIALAREVASYYRITNKRAVEIIEETKAVVSNWREEARAVQISVHEQVRMERAFRLTESRRET